MVRTAAHLTRTERPAEPPRAEMWGLLARFRRDPLGTYLDARRRYGDAILFRNLRGLPWLFIAHPDHVEHVHQRNNKNYGRGRLNEPFTMLLGDGLLTSERDTWLAHRRIMTPYFHQLHKTRFVEAVVAETGRMLDAWSDRAGTGRAFDVTGDLERLTFRVVVNGMFGFDWRAREATVLPALDGALEYVSRRSFSTFPSPGWLPSRARTRFAQRVKHLDDAVYEVIDARKTGAGRGGDLLDALVASGLDDGAVRDEVLTMLHAGQHTVASLLSFALYLLSVNPGAEEAVRNELAAVGEPEPGIDDLVSLPYLRMTIQETMRLYPPAWGGVREALADDDLGGVPVRAGTPVVFSQYVTHRHPEFWLEPDRFEPTRFTPEATAARHRYAYFPYGGGPHLCIGHELASIEAGLVLAMALRRYRFRMAPGHTVTPAPLLDLVPRDGVTMLLDPAAT